MFKTLKTLIKEYLFLIISIIVALILMYYKLPFRIEKTGGLINISERIDNLDNNNGSFNMAYVSEIDATILTYLYSLINSDWDIIDKQESNEAKITEKEELLRGQLLLQSSNQTAEIVAHQLANKDLSIKEIHYYIVYISNKSKTNLKIGDEILYVNNEPASNISDIISQSNIGSNLKITVLRNNKKITKKAQVIDYEGKKIGIMIVPIFDYNSTYKYKLSDSESGPSGGMMMTLAIYDSLTGNKLAKGRTIAGTGTIEIDGTVGEIGGVKYKLKGAVKDKADIFLVASDNYDEAMKIKKENNYKIKIVRINNIQEAIEYLKK